MTQEHSPISPKALAVLKKQFADWISKGKWHSGNVLSLTDDDIGTEGDWGKGKTQSEILERLKVGDHGLAEEIHQIRYDGGLDLGDEFLAEYRNSLLEARCSAEEIVQTLNFIDEHTEHSH